MGIQIIEPCINDIDDDVEETPEETNDRIGSIINLVRLFESVMRQYWKCELNEKDEQNFQNLLYNLTRYFYQSYSSHEDVILSLSEVGDKILNGMINTNS